MTDQSPRPNLNRDQTYLRHVKDLIQGRGEMGEIHFEYLTDLLSDLGFDTDLQATFSRGAGNEVVPQDTMTQFVEQAFDRLSIIGEPLPGMLDRLHRLWDHLVESDPLEHADLIFVFGGISKPCVEEAIRLKNEGFAPKIFFSGKKASYMGDVEITEAEQYAQMAIDTGVPREDIVIEKESVNTPENAVYSAILIHEMGNLPKKVIAVSLPYHMKRASLSLLASFDWEFKLICHPGLSAKYTRDTYFKDKNGWSYICFEYAKMFWARQAGHF